MLTCSFWGLARLLLQKVHVYTGLDDERVCCGVFPYDILYVCFIFRLSPASKRGCTSFFIYCSYVFLGAPQTTQRSLSRVSA